MKAWCTWCKKIQTRKQAYGTEKWDFALTWHIRVRITRWLVRTKLLFCLSFPLICKKTFLPIVMPWILYFGRPRKAVILISLPDVVHNKSYHARAQIAAGRGARAGLAELKARSDRAELGRGPRWSWSGCMGYNSGEATSWWANQGVVLTPWLACCLNIVACYVTS